MIRAILDSMTFGGPRGPWWAPKGAARGCLVAFGVAASLGCEQFAATFEADPDGVQKTEGAAFEPPPPPDLCGMEIERLLDLEEQVGTPELDAQRAEILARARAVPVVFHRRPTVVEPVSDKVRELRALLEAEEDPADAILEVLRRTRGDYEARRAIFLTEDYLYSERVLLALRLSQVLRLDHLFSQSEPELVIERGDEIIRVSRSEGRYFLPPLEEPAESTKRKHAPRLASLLLFDRVRAESRPFSERLHTDLRPVQQALGFSTAKVIRRTSQGMVVELGTYGARSRAIFEDQDGTARLVCESVEPNQMEALTAARRGYHLDQEFARPVLSAAHQMIDRSLPFDEPKTEEGQQDGLLRIHFRKAYKSYKHTYEFNGDNYFVFDGFGRPRVPQVCIDFITDAFDWGTGGHWPVRGEKRLYQKGALHFGSMGIENPRSVENLAEYATETPEWFDMLWLEKSEQIKFRHRSEFFSALLRDQDRYRRGDVVFIYGLKDDGKFHYHSFLIDEKDPLTGMPMVVVANAGPPQARTWEGEMQNAPQRSIVARLRVRQEILQAAYAQAATQPGVPLPPPVRRGDEVEVPPEADSPPPRPDDSEAPVAGPSAPVAGATSLPVERPRGKVAAEKAAPATAVARPTTTGSPEPEPPALSPPSLRGGPESAPETSATSPSSDRDSLSKGASEPAPEESPVP